MSTAPGETSAENPSLWVREAPALAPERPPLPDRADVVVVGGGIAGVSASCALARLGVGCALLEAGTIASRASGRNDGQILLGLGEHYNRIVGQFGREQARVLWHSIQDNHEALRGELDDAGIDCHLERAGGLRLAETPHEWTELQDAAALLAEDGIEHQLLDADVLREVFPLAEQFHGALRLPGEAVVQPAAMVRGLARVAREHGATIHEHARVARIETHGSEHRITLQDGRTIAATAVVHCTSTLARELDESGFLARNLFPFRGQIIATDPLPDDLARAFPPYAMSSNFCYEYFRMHDRRYVVGGMRWSVPGEEQGLLDDDNHNEQITHNLRDWTARHFPPLADVPTPHVWTGIMAGTGDGLPLCGALPGAPGVFALCGFNGYGLSFAWLAGRSLAEQVVEGRASDPGAALFAPRRFV